MPEKYPETITLRELISALLVESVGMHHARFIVTDSEEGKKSFVEAINDHECDCPPETHPPGPLGEEELQRIIVHPEATQGQETFTGEMIEATGAAPVSVVIAMGPAALLLADMLPMIAMMTGAKELTPEDLQERRAESGLDQQVDVNELLTNLGLSAEEINERGDQ